MANLATWSVALSFQGANGVLSKPLVVSGTDAPSGSGFGSGVLVVPITTAAAIPLGGLTGLGTIAIVNRDPTNFITILTGTGGVVMAKLNPGKAMLLPTGSGVTAPFWLADTATCLAEILFLEP